MSEHEYDLSSLIEVKPQGERFPMLVTPRYRGHYEDCVYEAFSSRLVGAVTGRAGLFLDLGAHYGFYSLMVATRHPGLDVIAVEPIPETHFILKENTSRIGADRVQVHRAAVSDSEGLALFNRAELSVCSSFYLHPNAAVLERVEVPTRTVDSLLSDRTPCSLFVKIDTEGHEVAVLRGMERTLATWPDISLLLEFNPKMERIAGHDPMDVIRLLDNLGFSCFLLDDRACTSTRITPTTDWVKLMHPEAYANLYCVRRDRALSVCFFAHDAKLSGASLSLKELVGELIADYGVLATVVVPGPGPLGLALRELGASVLELPLSSWCSFPPHLDSMEPSKLLPSLSSLLEQVLPTLRRIQPDILFSQTLATPWGAVAAALLGIPHVWSVCEYGEADHDLRFPYPFQEVLEDIRQGSNLVLVNSENLRRTLFPGGKPEQVQVLRRHIVLPDSGCTSTNLYKIPESIRIGCFATLQASKGQMDAVEALGYLTAQGINAELLLAGWAIPEYREMLEQKIREMGLEDRVHLVGFLDDPYPAMRASDILLQCSRQEAFGRSALEAMLLGKPLVYTLAGGFQEYLEDGRTGLGYPPGDIQALVRAITTLIAQPEQACALGTAAQIEASHRFNREAYGGVCFDLLKRLREASDPPNRIPRVFQQLLVESWMSVSRDLLRQQESLRDIEASLEEHRQVSQRETELLTHQLEDTRSTVDLLTQHLRDTQATIDTLTKQLGEAQGQLSTVLHSASWRNTRHFRRWKRSLDKRIAKIKAIFNCKRKCTSVDSQSSDDDLKRTRGRRSPFRWLLFHTSGKPRRVVRVFLFHTSGRPRGELKSLVLHPDGRPREAFSRWMTSTDYLALPDLARRPQVRLVCRDVCQTPNNVEPLSPLSPGKKQVLFIDSNYPDPNRDSGSVDTINYVTWLVGLGYEVVFLSTSYNADNKAEQPILIAGARVLHLSGESEVIDFLSNEGPTFAFFLLSRVYCGGKFFEACRRSNPKAGVIFNTVDLHHLREGREARIRHDRIGVFRAQTVRERELYIARQSDLTIVVSDQERDILASAVPGTKIGVMPLFRPIPTQIGGFIARSGIGFIGGFAHSPNVDAVRFFLDNIWPSVQALDSGIAFEIAGPDLPDDIAESLPSGVTYMGQIADLEGWLGRLRLTVAPLRYGAGAKGKVASSIVNGVPVVGTRVAFEGMGLGSEAVVTAEEPTEFANEVVRIHSNQAEWEFLSNGARAYGLANLSPEAGLKRFAMLLGDLPGASA